MFRAIFLLCVIVIGVCSSAEQTTQPYLQYKCKEGGTIEFNVDQTFKSVYVSGTNSTGASDNDNCDKLYQTGTSPLTITKCQSDKPITVILMSLEQKGTGNVIGGPLIEVYELNCYSGNAVSPRSIKFTLTRTAAPFELTDKPPHIEGNLPDSVVTMSISPSSAVVIGTELTLTIEGPDSFVYLATNCKAFNSEMPVVERILIKDGEVDKTSGDHYLMSEFTNRHAAATKVSMASTIHAFHFAKGTQVTFQCTILVCNNVTSCAESDKESHMASKNVHKRSSAARSDVLKATIVVYDNFDLEVQSAGCNISLSKWLTMFLAVLVIEEFHAQVLREPK